MPTRASAPDITTQRTSKSNARLWPYKLLIEPTPDWESNAKGLAGPLRSAHHLAGLMQHKRESFRNPGNPQSEVGFHASQEISYIPQKSSGQNQPAPTSSNRNHSIHSEEAQTRPDAGVGRSA